MWRWTDSTTGCAWRFTFRGAEQGARRATGESIRRRLLAGCAAHTLLRLPTGSLYAGGVKANLGSFDGVRPGRLSPWTTDLWVYDLWTNQRFAQQQPLRRHHLDDFVASYAPDQPRSLRLPGER